MALQADFIRPYGTHLPWGDCHGATHTHVETLGYIRCVPHGTQNHAYRGLGVPPAGGP
jgi:hypothetical protein